MRVSYTLWIAILTWHLSGCIHSPSIDDLTDVMSPEQQQSLMQADIILLGEQHDNPDHHKLQAQIVEMLGQAGVLGAVVFEQVNWDQQVIVSNLSNRNLHQLETQLNWAKSGWPSFKFYEPIFTTATRFRAPIIAGNISSEKSKAVYKEGYHAVFSLDEQKLLGLTKELDGPAMTALKKEVFEGHCQMIPEDHVSAMVPIQRARDAAMALAWHKHHKTGKAIFIVGSGHARKDFGLPWYLKQLDPSLKIWSIGMNEKGSEAQAGAYDQVITTDPILRDDPCAELDKKWNKGKSNSSPEAK